MAKHINGLITRNGARGPRRKGVGYVSCTGAFVEVPFVVAVLADLTGANPPKERLADRRFLEFDAATLDNHMKALAPRVSMLLPSVLSGKDGDLPIDMTFESMSDFTPDAIARQVEPLRLLLNHREQLRSLADQCDGADAAKLELMIAVLYKTVSAQVNQVLHHPHFQALEATWRGLRILCANTEADETLRILVLNVSKRELAEALEEYADDDVWDKSPVYSKLFPYSFSGPVPGGAFPFSVLIGDLAFAHHADDVAMLREIGRICASRNLPFIAAADPALLSLESWADVCEVEDLTARCSNVSHAGWNDLRCSEDARYLALTMPRFLARMPYGQNGMKASGFAFEEEVEAAHHDHFLWANSAYAMGVTLTRTFRETGWPVQTGAKQSWGELDNLPFYTLETDNGLQIKSPTECAIDMRREAELSANGLMPLVWFVGETNAAFIGGRTLIDLRAVKGMRPGLPIGPA